MTRPDGSRDHELGAALRELEVPDHRPEFFARVQADIETPTRRRRAGAPPRRPRVHEQRSRPVLPRVAAIATAGVVMIAVIAVVVGIGAPPETTRVASAAEVRAKVISAWATADNVSGALVVRNPKVYGDDVRRWDFLLTAGGDLRLVDKTRGGELAYDVEANVQRSLSPSESIGDSDVLFASVRKGLAPGWPDQGPSYGVLDRNLGSVVRALAAGGDASVEDVTYRGRPAWRLDSDIRPNLLAGDDAPDGLTVTVDKETGFPLRVVATNDGRRVWVTRVNDIVVDGPVPAGAFTVDLPPGAEVFRSDAGFRRVPLDDVESRVGYTPLVPTGMPDGYQLADVRVSHKPSPTGTEGGNPAVRDVVALSYRRGLDHAIVTMRPTGGDVSRWSDPLATGEGFIDRPETVRLSGGALEGVRAELLIDPLAIPHLWAIADGLVITVSGDLTRDELVDVAQSLREGAPRP